MNDRRQQNQKSSTKTTYIHNTLKSLAKKKSCITRGNSLKTTPILKNDSNLGEKMNSHENNDRAIRVDVPFLHLILFYVHFIFKVI